MARRCQVRLKEAEERGADLEARAGIAARRVPITWHASHLRLSTACAVLLLVGVRSDISRTWHASHDMPWCSLCHAAGG